MRCRSGNSEEVKSLCKPLSIYLCVRVCICAIKNKAVPNKILVYSIATWHSVSLVFVLVDLRFLFAHLNVPILFCLALDPVVPRARMLPPFVALVCHNGKTIQARLEEAVIREKSVGCEVRAKPAVGLYEGRATCQATCFSYTVPYHPNARVPDHAMAKQKASDTSCLSIQHVCCPEVPADHLSYGLFIFLPPKRDSQ